MKTLFFHLWQLPQHLVAWFILLFKRPIRYDIYKNKKVYRYNNKRSCSLGDYIFISPNVRDQATIAHEYGHSVQSRILGPLYLFTVGICSVSNPFSTARYYSVWCEWWANKIAGIEVEVFGNRACDFKLIFKK